MRAGNTTRTSPPILGFAANRRFVAAAAGGFANWMRVYRLDRSPLGYVRSAAWVGRIVAVSAPRLVVLVAEDEHHARKRDEPTEDMIRALGTHHHVPVLEIARSDIARTLGLTVGSTSAICRELARREGIVMRATGSRDRGPRSERARHWELAVVALAGVQAAQSIVREDRNPAVGLGSCAPKT